MTDTQTAVARLREALERASEGLQFRKDANAKLGAICYGLLPGVLDELERLNELAKPSDLDRAQALLRRWRDAAGERYYRCSLQWDIHGRWSTVVAWLHEDGRHFGQVEFADINPLEAVRPAIAQTPWQVTEEQDDEAE